MQRQLQDAGVVHLDISCKNVLVKDGALTLADFDAALVDGFPGRLLQPWGNPARSDQPQRWVPSLRDDCFLKHAVPPSSSRAPDTRLWSEARTRLWMALSRRRGQPDAAAPTTERAKS